LPAAAWTRLPGVVEHGFTHFRLELTVLAARTEAAPAGVWARPRDFPDYAFSTLMRKLARYALSAA
jgi:A/G-specific adenine glycosylase